MFDFLKRIFGISTQSEKLNEDDFVFIREPPPTKTSKAVIDNHHNVSDVIGTSGEVVTAWVENMEI